MKAENEPTGGPGRPSRRAVLAVPGAAGVAAALGGCSTYGDTAGPQPDPASAPPAEPPTDGPTELPTELPESEPGPGKPALAKLADVPVGGGTILRGEEIVLTQPKAGTVKAFSAKCTHAGCQVTEVSGGTINCPCHGSKFKIADGSVAAGPAPRPLSGIAVAVDGDRITRA